MRGLLENAFNGAFIVSQAVLLGTVLVADHVRRGGRAVALVFLLEMGARP